MIGLLNCKNTLIGDNSQRGISGGEKRRVSLGEVLLGPHRLIVLDKFSTGLDSAITNDILRMLKEWALVYKYIYLLHLFYSLYLFIIIILLENEWYCCLFNVTA